MFMSVALSRVVPYFIFLFEDPRLAQSHVNSADRAIWERAYATVAVADREASIILHTILQSIRPSSSSQTVYHDPTLARMRPLSPAATTEVLDLLTPDMQALVVEANIKNNSVGPIATAWEAALRKAVRLPSPTLEKKEVEENEKPGLERSLSSSSSAPNRFKNFWEKEVVDEVVTVPAIVSEPQVEEH